MHVFPICSPLWWPGRSVNVSCTYGVYTRSTWYTIRARYIHGTSMLSWLYRAFLYRVCMVHIHDTVRTVHTGYIHDTLWQEVVYRACIVHIHDPIYTIHTRYIDANMVVPCICPTVHVPCIYTIQRLYIVIQGTCRIRVDYVHCIVYSMYRACIVHIHDPIYTIHTRYIEVNMHVPCISPIVYVPCIYTIQRP